MIKERLVLKYPIVGGGPFQRVIAFFVQWAGIVLFIGGLLSLYFGWMPWWTILLGAFLYILGMLLGIQVYAEQEVDPRDL